MERSKDWLAQSEKDFDAANDSLKSKHYEWVCFQSQQSSKKALKALLLSMNIDIWGHSVTHLLNRWSDIVDEKEIIDNKSNILEQCQELDRHYIQPRYPNGFLSGYPAEYYNEKTAKECLKNVSDIIQFVKEKIRKVSSPK